MINVLTLMPNNPQNIKKAADKYFHKDELELFYAREKQSFFELLSENRIDFVLISNDGISNENMIDIVQRIRLNYEEIIIMVLTPVEDRSLAMKLYLLGIDEWIKRPVDAMEVALRCRAMFRRIGVQSKSEVEIGDLFVDFNSHIVKTGSEEIHLPRKEFMLLHLLLSHPDKIYSKTELMEQIWGFDSDSSDATVAVHIDRIRKKFRNTSSFKIVSIRGVGYKAVINA